jgi:hypothetical protein
MARMPSRPICVTHLTAGGQAGAHREGPAAAAPATDSELPSRAKGIRRKEGQLASIRRVTDIVAEIAAASTEQASGVGQVGEAVTHMDKATQQNAAMVEEMAAAASGLRSQAQELVQVVAAFRL